MTLTAATIESLRNITGGAGIVGPDEDLDGFVTEWRSRYVGTAALVVMPASVEEAARVVRVCAESGIAMVPQGGNTGLCGGAIPFSEPERPQVILSARRLRRIRDLDSRAFTVTADAGVTVRELQVAAEKRNRLFALSLASEGTASLGGVISTNAGGVNVLRYGTMREQVLGVEAVLSDGQVLRQLGGLRKDNTGYRIGDLLIGSEGTLGFVTAAVCRLHAMPRATLTALLALETIDDCLAIAGEVRGAAAGDVTALELLSNPSLQLVLEQVEDVVMPFAKASPWYLLVEFSGPDDWDALEARLAGLVHGLAENPRVIDACLAGSIAQREALWALRHNLSAAQKLAGRSFKHDISVPPGKMAGFVASCSARLIRSWPGSTPVVFGHLGDGNLHFNLMQAPGSSGADFEEQAAAVQRVVHDAVDAVGGSISAEHGIGIARRDELLRLAEPPRIALMRAVKDVFDPTGLMNPGKVLGEHRRLPGPGLT